MLAPAGYPLAGEVRTSGKGSSERCTRRTHPPGPLKTNSFEARYPPGLLPWPVPPTNFAPAGGRARTTPQGCGRVRHSRGRVTVEERHPSRHPTTDLRAYHDWFWYMLLLHTCQPPSLQLLCPIGRTRKRYHQRTQPDSQQRGIYEGRICCPIPKPTEQGLQGEDTEKRRQKTTLLDRPLERKCLRTPAVHLHHCLWVVVHHADPFAVHCRFNEEIIPRASWNTWKESEKLNPTNLFTNSKSVYYFSLFLIVSWVFVAVQRVRDFAFSNQTLAASHFRLPKLM